MVSRDWVALLMVLLYKYYRIMAIFNIDVVFISNFKSLYAYHISNLKISPSVEEYFTGNNASKTLDIVLIAPLEKAPLEQRSPKKDTARGFLPRKYRPMSIR
jgi:hypothetical protein